MGRLFSFQEKVLAFFSFSSMEAVGIPSDGNITSSKWQFANLSIKSSLVDGSRKLIMDDKSNPT